MKSIRMKIVLLLTVTSLVLTISIGTISVIIANKVAADEANNNVNAACNDKAMKLDLQLNLAEYSVDTLYSIADEELDSIEQLKDEQYRKQYIENIKHIALEISNHTEGALAVYFRLNPNVVNSGVEGFFLSKNNEGKFLDEKNTDLYEYETWDVEHVGWYYIPVRAGRNIWIEPYHNKNINKDMISYVMPFYKEGKLIGVVGMDIDFDIFIEIASEIDLYDTSAAYLVDTSNKNIYYDKDAHIKKLKADKNFYNNLVVSKTNDELLDYKINNKRYKIAFETLDNGMKVVVLTALSEINVYRNSLILVIIGMTLIILTVSVLCAYYMAGRIVKPLKNLTLVASQFSEGNWSAKVSCNTKDEVKQLADSLMFMADKTQLYIEQLNELAINDSLTKAKNKTGYVKYINELTENASHEKPYAVVVLDINGLKLVNDKYGHEMGDKLIISSCERICKIFKNSEVFRIGGDEFVVILQDENFEKREKLIEIFNQQIISEKIIDVDVNVSIALGMSEFPKESNQYEQLFNLADERMYQNKIKMKKEINNI